MRIGDAPSVHVVQEIATAEEIDPTELRPLHEVLDPDALDELIHGASADLTVEFAYGGYSVRVDGAGRVTVDAVDQARSNAESGREQ